eukprot:TRINITY_DN9769_c0_g1_i10.p1 TRINITY_DN9769_c0_g1~~TRINITY_DN9769_c0_g1_i10.p1  ORF type:complete len:361 (-),score=108.09 TRINITY_DN9769_c0_g1_i10:42-1124(-)
MEPEDMKYLQWISPAKAPSRSRIDITTVVSISFGFKTPLFQKHKELLKGKDELAVAINYQTKDKDPKSLNLIFLNPERMQLFITGLQYLIIKQVCGLILSQTSTRDKSFLNELWEKNKAEAVKLDVESVRGMVRELNVGVYPLYFERLAKSLANPENSKLTKADFIALVKNLTEHTELIKVLRRYSKNPSEELTANTVISVEGLRKFFTEVQKEPITLDECRSLIQVATCFFYSELGDLAALEGEKEDPNALRSLSAGKFEKTRRESEVSVCKKQVSVETAQEMTLMDFSKMILSRTNTVVNDSNPFETDMDYPLPYYLINTSNYTYLKLNKETNELEVSVENYKTVSYTHLTLPTICSV